MGAEPSLADFIGIELVRHDRIGIYVTRMELNCLFQAYIEDPRRVDRNGSKGTGLERK
jgi:hypothetical protein